MSSSATGQTNPTPKTSSASGSPPENHPDDDDDEDEIMRLLVPLERVDLYDPHQDTQEYRERVSQMIDTYARFEKTELLKEIFKLRHYCAYLVVENRELKKYCKNQSQQTSKVNFIINVSSEETAMEIAEKIKNGNYPNVENVQITHQGLSIQFHPRLRPQRRLRLQSHPPQQHPPTR